MIKENIENKRQILNRLILEESDYAEILRLSQELDKYIMEYMSSKAEKVYIPVEKQKII